MSKPRAASSYLSRVLRGTILLLVLVLVLPYLITPIYLAVQPVSTPMLWRWVMRERVVRNTVPLDAVAPALPLAVIAAEDGRFCTHFGIDLAEIRDAIEDAEDITEARGGSTISQQLAKNLFLWPGRSFVRKALEVPLAMWMDLVLGKRRVLEIYLNVAEWGPNGEFGAEAGSRRAFDKSARNLTVREAALLAAVLPNPIRRNARQPGPGLRRLAGIYAGRVAASAGLDSCVRQRR